MSYRPQAPLKPGRHIFKELSLRELSNYIDWTPFFISWEMKGSYPAILEDAVYGKEATNLFNDAQAILDRIIVSGKLHAHAICQVFPAQSVNDDDVELYTDDSRSNVLATLHFLRQQAQKASSLPNICLSDFIAPKDSEIADYMGAFIVTAGIGCDAICKEYEAQHDEYSSIMVKAIADRLAEASAEYLHQKVRKEIWGYIADETLENTDLIAEKYQGIRPAPGYPACPDHTEKLTLFSLLNGEEIGVSLTESLAMMPAASVCGWYFAHPKAQYFTIGKIEKDQVREYAQRKNMSIEECERWLAPILAY
ncbi:MAG: vitamin B12 dependent-methionine synthase activation domain-containing protein [Candidatus Kapaibacteriota bacterium]